VDGIRAVAADWAAADPNDDNRREIARLLDGDPADLNAAFGGRITFGTAGLRGPLGPGPRAMNAVVVAQTARAVAAWLPAASVVTVGYDARHESLRFARAVADVMALAGHEPRLLAKPSPTPLIAFQVASPEADAGIVITASHNPARDNGMKIYAPSGAQIDDTQAEAISAMIDPSNLGVPEPTVAMIDPNEHRRIEQRYLSTIADGAGSPARALRVAYTPMHGVGRDLAVEAMTAAGHEVHVVARQAEPDPDFPTAPFPNPEEPGALDELLATADAADADIALAHDPDADRLAVAIRASDGSWYQLSGDEVGAILAEYLLTQAGSAGSDNPAIRDKDGISAALVLLGCAAVEPLDQVLDRVHARHGAHASAQVSIRFDTADAQAQMAALVDRIATSVPEALGSFAVVEEADIGGVQVLGLEHDTGSGRICIRPSGTEPKVKIYVEAINDGGSDGTASVDSMLAELVAAVEDEWVPSPSTETA